jgi:hemoglobin
MKDIETREDVSLMVNTFYDKVFKDELLSPHFTHVDFKHHMPRMIDFWCFTVLDEGSFRGNIFDKHAPLKIDQTHFDRWLFLFEENMKELFSGVKAEMAINRAKLIGYTFASKMKEMKDKE